MALKYFFKTLLLRLIYILLKMTKTKKKNIQVKKTVLIIKPDAIGDMVLFTGSLKYYRDLYPSESYRLVLVCNKVYSSYLDWLLSNKVISKNENLVDELLPIERNKVKKISYVMGFMSKLINLNAEIALYPVYSRDSIGDFVLLYSGAKYKVAYSGDYLNQSEYQTIKNNKQIDRLIYDDKSNSELQHNKKFLEELGFQAPNNLSPKWNIPNMFLAQVKEKFKVNTNNFNIVLVPGASWEKRRWDTQKYSEFIVKSLEKYKNIKFYILGASSETHLGEEIIRNLGTECEQVVNLCGVTSLEELTAIIKLSDLYVGSETGSVHIASAVGTPTICILGGGHYERFFPYPSPFKESGFEKNRFVTYRMDCFKCNWNCIYNLQNLNNVPCIGKVDTEKVLSILGEIILKSEKSVSIFE